MRGEFRVVRGCAVAVPLVAVDPERFQADCAEAYAASWVARGFSQVTVDSATSRLERVLATFGKPAWEVTREDVDRVVGDWAAAGIAASAGRDYALYRTLYHAGLRAEEAASLELGDLHFGRGPFGKIHVRFGKGAKTSGPRPRWVPMLDGLDLILRWFTDDVRTRFPGSAALFCDEGGGRLHRGTIRNRLRHLLDLEGCTAADRFTPHQLRHACAP